MKLKVVAYIFKLNFLRLIFYGESMKDKENQKREFENDLCIGLKPNDYPVIDYDIQDEIKVENDINSLREKFNLKSCLLFKTRKGFRAVFIFDKVSDEQYIKILKTSKYVDKRFVFMMQCLSRSNRVAGKYSEPDFRFVKVIPEGETDLYTYLESHNMLVDSEAAVMGLFMQELGKMRFPCVSIDDE